MIPYEQFQLPVGLLNFIKKQNQRKSIANYIKKYGVEPDTETVQSFFVATEEQIEKARIQCYSFLLAKEVNGQTDVDVDPSSGGDNNENEPSFSLEQETVSGQKGSQFISVLNVPGNWAITCDADWIQVAPDRGRGDSNSIALSYDANVGGDPRRADICLVSGDISIVLTLRQDALSDDEPESDWLELPLMNDDELTYRCHYANFLNERLRNYTFAFSAKDRLSKWVAYPLNRKLIGSGTRTMSWGFDSLLPEEVQANVTTTFRGGFTRGNLLPSANRLYNEPNTQVWLSTNIVPLNVEVQTGVLASVEDTMRSIALQNDDSYVVAGVVIGESPRTATDTDGKTINVPDFIYEVMLSHNKSSSTKEWTTYCALIENNANGEAEYMSISELEDITGMCFYPNLKDIVGEQKYNEIKAPVSADYTVTNVDVLDDVTSYVDVVSSGGEPENNDIIDGYRVHEGEEDDFYLR